MIATSAANPGAFQQSVAPDGTTTTATWTTNVNGKPVVASIETKVSSSAAVYQTQSYAYYSAHG